MRKAIKISILIGTAAAWLCAVGMSRAADPDEQKFDRIQRGHYLATVADCFAFHTVPKVGKPFAGARPLENPFDVIITYKITPETETCIDSRTDQQSDVSSRQ